MSSLQFFLLTTLIMVGLFFSSYLTNTAGAMGNGPYTLMRHSNTSANAGVFRLDTNSGGVSYCYVSHNTELLCSKEVH